MLLPSPANRVSGYRRMESPTPELQFGIVNSIATLDQAESQAARPATNGLVVQTEFAFKKHGVLVLTARRQTAHLLAVERGKHFFVELQSL